MPENASPLYDLFESTWNKCGTVSKWICKPIYSILEFLPLRRPVYRLVEGQFRHSPSYQLSPYMDVIEIDSSDSDNDKVEDAEFADTDVVVTDTGQRQSTALAPQSYDSHNYASNGQAAASQATKRQLPSSFQNNHIRKTTKPSFVYRSRPIIKTVQKQHIEVDDASKSESTSYARDKGGLDERLKQDASMRVIPSSFQPIVKLSHSKSIGNFDLNSRDYHGPNGNGLGIVPYSFNNGRFTTSTSGNEYNDDFRHKFPRPSSNGNENIHGMPKYSAERRDDFYTRGAPDAFRNLPSSMLQGKYNNFQKSNFNDVEKPLGHGEDRGTEHGERLIFQQALQNLNQPKDEDDLPDGLLAVPLLRHQKIALAWMVKKEQSAVCAGGILADDQGLGKTISMIALIQKQKIEQLRYASCDSNDKKLEALNIDDDDDDDEGLDKLDDKAMQTESDNKKHNMINCVELDEKKIPTVMDNTKHDAIGTMSHDEKVPTRAFGNKRAVASTSKSSSGSSRPAGGTLVVCPASVLRQWARELDERIPEGGKLSVLVYHGGSRTKDPHDLIKYDVILTTYAIVVNEVPEQTNVDDGEMDSKNADRYGLTSEFSAKNKRKQKNKDRKNQKKKCKGLDDSNLGISGGALARVRWFRVILDEAQSIKNYKTLVAGACCSLRAKRRWCLSGTPVQNTIDDLFSYFRFLKVEPYDSYGQFSLLIKNPIARNQVNGYKKLQAVLKTILLRRTKGTLIDGKPILNLPPKTICLEKIDFVQEEREFYSNLEADTRKQFKAFYDAGTVKQNYASILVMLLRLRQACDHPFLVSNRKNSDAISKESLSMVKQLPKDMMINLLNQLEDSFAICVLCNDPPEDAVVSMCGHVFCYQCVSDRLTGEDNSCPSPGCRDILGADLVFSKSTLTSCIFDNFDNKASSSSSSNVEQSVISSSYISSKIRAAINILNKLSCSNSISSPQNTIGEYFAVSKFNNNLAGCSSDSNATSFSLSSNSGVPSKAIVFSQWTGMLDLLELSLNQELIQYRRLDGSMPLNLRDKAVKDFNTDPEVVVMLMSLKAGSLGLNMVSACHVILLDLWWNPTSEDQAIDRAHRIGQTRPVTVSRLTIKDTVEDRILALQDTKRKMVASCFGEDGGGSQRSRLTVEDLRYLFNG